VGDVPGDTLSRHPAAICRRARGSSGDAWWASHCRSATWRPRPEGSRRGRTSSAARPRSRRWACRRHRAPSRPGTACGWRDRRRCCALPFTAHRAGWPDSSASHPGDGPLVRERWQRGQPGSGWCLHGLHTAGSPPIASRARNGPAAPHASLHSIHAIDTAESIDDTGDTCSRHRGRDDFFRRFYHLDLTDDQLALLLRR